MAALLWAAVFLLVVLESVLAIQLFTSTHRSYDLDDAIVLFAVFPAGALAVSASLVLASIWLAVKLHASSPPLAPPLASLVVVVLFGVGGLHLAKVEGPHTAAFFVVYLLIAQVVALVVSYFSVRKWVRRQTSLHGSP